MYGEDPDSNLTHFSQFNTVLGKMLMKDEFQKGNIHKDMISQRGKSKNLREYRQ